MKSKLYLVALLSSLSFNVLAEIFTVGEVGKDEEGTLTEYKVANKVVEVNYVYQYNAMHDSPTIHLDFKKSDTSVNDILTFGLFVDNIESPIRQRSQIVSNGLHGNDNCIYEGKAKLILSDAWMYIPDQQSEAQHGVTVNQVILATPPKVKCH